MSPYTGNVNYFDCKQLMHGRYVLIKRMDQFPTEIRLNTMQIHFRQPRKYFVVIAPCFLVHECLLCLLSARNPLVRDCSELERLGFTNPGAYFLDPTGNRDVKTAILAHCHQGWTYILKRDQGDNVDPVSCQELMDTYVMNVNVNICNPRLCLCQTTCSIMRPIAVILKAVNSSLDWTLFPSKIILFFNCHLTKLTCHFRLTNAEPMNFQVRMWTAEGRRYAQADYDSFVLDDAAALYAFHVDGFSYQEQWSVGVKLFTFQ